MKRKDIIFILILVAVIALAAYKYYTRIYTDYRTEFLLDTVIEISVSSKNKDMGDVLHETFELIKKYENKFSYHNPESELNKINNSKESNIDVDFYRILRTNEDLFALSDSLYDITVGTLTDIWDFDEEIIPTLEDIREAKKFTGFEKITFTNHKLQKPAGVKLNPGSLSKGFIVDRVIEFLKSKEIISGMVNAGGDISFFGQPKPLKIGIQHPRDKRNEVIKVIKVQHGAVVSSGDYERFFIHDEKRYHHIINPKTGYPSEEAISITVISDKAFTSDAYSTALFLLTPQKAIQIANETENLEALIYYEEDDEIKSIQSAGFGKYETETSN